MRYLRMAVFTLLPVVALALAGCGSSGGGTTPNDPLSNTPSINTQTNSNPIFGTISSATGKIGITMVTDRATVDVNNGQVLVTSTVLSGGVGLPGVPVTFSIVAPANGPANIEAGLTTVTTDSNGMAITRITTGNTATTTNVIVSASATIGTRSATASTTFHIVRGGGVIMFTPIAGDPSGSQSNLLKPSIYEADASFAGGVLRFQQLIPFKAIDTNGNPRVGLPVTLSVYSITTRDKDNVTIDFLVDPITETTQQMITTDSAGQGIFNASIAMIIPPPGGVNTVAVVYKAVTNDTMPVAAYVGNVYTINTTPFSAVR